jgi:hypothetical protein
VGGHLSTRQYARLVDEWVTDEVHALLSTAVAAKSDDEAVAAVKEANKLLIDEHAIYVPVAEYAHSYIISDRIAESGIGASFYSVATLEKAHLA